MARTCAHVVRIGMTVGLLLSGNGTPLSADDAVMREPSAGRATLDHVRSPDPVLAAAIDRGMNESPTFITLVSHLEHSDVIVYLVRDTCPGRRVVGCVASISRSGGVRYIRINLVLVRQAAATSLKQMQVRLVAQIGHELQHAVEIADEPSIVDAPTLEKAYSRERAYRNTVGFETNAAIDTGEHVLKDLTRTARNRPSGKSQARATTNAKLAPGHERRAF